MTLILHENELYTRQLLCPLRSKCRVKQTESRDLNRATVTCQFSPLHEEGYGGFFCFLPGVFKTGLGKIK